MSNTIRKFSIFASLVALLWVMSAIFTGCAAGPGEPDQPKPTVTTTIYGQIVDEAGLPVSGVQVTAHTASATTDVNGLFVMKNAIVPEGRLVVLAKKAGYFTAARAESPKVNGATRTKLFLMSKSGIQTVSASTGGTVNVTGGASVAFAASSFKTSSGAAYTGTVNVAARYLDPASMSFGDYFAGDALAQTAAGAEVSLISCGVLRVEITDQGGQPLSLDAAKPATLTYPKPTSNATAPSSMPLWYFDETLGMWKEEGTATLVGGKYVGTVTHFTDWNLDYSGPYGTLQFRVVCNTVGVEGVAVKIAGFDHKTGYTAADGSITFIRVPADKEIEIHIRAVDNKGLYFITTPVKVQLTPDQVNIIPDIVLNSPCPATLQGKLVGCEGESAEGLVTVTYGSEVSYVYTKSGDFALVVPSGTPLQVAAMDIAGNNSIPVDVAALAESELRQMGTVTVCGPKTVAFKDIDFGAGPNVVATTIAFSPDGSLVAAYLTSGKIVIYETATATKKTEMTAAMQNRYNSSMQFSADNKKLLLVAMYGELELYDVASATKLMSLTKTMGGFISDDGENVIGIRYGTTDPVALYSSTGTFIKKINIPLSAGADSSGEMGYLRAENALIFFDGIANVYRVWSIDTDAETRTFASTQTQSWHMVSFSEDGERLSETSDAKKFTILNTVSGTKLTDITAQVLQGTKEGAIFLTKELVYGSELVNGGRFINMYSTSDASIKGTRLVSGADYIGAIAANRTDDHLGAIIQTGMRIWQLK